MSNSVNIDELLTAVDQATRPFRTLQTANVSLSDGIKETEKTLRGLYSRVGQIDSFTRSQRALTDVSARLKTAKEQAKALATEMRNSDAPTRTQTKALEKARENVSKLSQQHNTLRLSVKNQRQTLRQAGISTRAPATARNRLQGQIGENSEQLTRQRQAQRQENRQSKLAKLQRGKESIEAMGAKVSAVGNVSMSIAKTGFAWGKKLLQPGYEQSLKNNAADDAASPAATLSGTTVTTSSAASVLSGAAAGSSAAANALNGAASTLSGAAGSNGAAESLNGAMAGSSAAASTLNGAMAGSSAAANTLNGAAGTLSSAGDFSGAVSSLSSAADSFGAVSSLSGAGECSCAASTSGNATDSSATASILTSAAAKFSSAANTFHSATAKFSGAVTALSGATAESSASAVSTISTTADAGLSTAVSASGGSAGAGAQAGNLGTDLAALQAAYQSLSVDLFSQQESSLRKLVQTATEYVGKLQQWVSNNQGLTQTLGLIATVVIGVAGAIGSVASVIAPVFSGISTLITLATTFSGVFTSVGGIIMGVLGSLTLPIIGIIAAFATAAAAIYAFWEPISAFFGGVVEGIKAGFAPLAELFTPFQPVFDAIGQALGSIKGLFSELPAPISFTQETLQTFGDVGKFVGQALVMAFTWPLQTVRWLKEGVGWLLEKLHITNKEPAGDVPQPQTPPTATGAVFGAIQPNSVSNYQAVKPASGGSYVDQSKTDININLQGDVSPGSDNSRHIQDLFRQLEEDKRNRTLSQFSMQGGTAS